MAFGGAAAATRGKIARAALAGISLLACHTALYGQASNAQLATQSSSAVNVSVPAGPLETGILSLGRQTNLRMLYPSNLTAGKRTSGVSGRLTPREAVAMLLAGTGLHASFTGSNTVRIFDPSAASAGGSSTAGGVLLETIEVQGGGASGYVATAATVGTKTNTPLIETPQSVSVVTRNEMDTRNVQRERDAFRYTSGVFAEPYGADARPLFDAPYIRGFDQSTTGVYRDGLREARGVWTGFLSEYYGLESIAVLKGPSSVLYGQANPGGIVDKISKRPPSTPLREVELQAGTFDRYQGAVDLGGPIDKDGQFLYRITGLYRDSGTQFEYDKNNRIPEDRKYIAPAVTWRPTVDTKLTVRADYLYNLTAAPFMVTLTKGNPTHLLIGDPSFNKSETEQKTIGYQFEHRFDSVWSVRQNLRYGEIDFEYRNMSNTGLQANGRTINRSASQINEELSAFALDNQAEAKFQTGVISHTVLIGLDYQWASYDTRTRGIVAPPLDLINPVYWQTIPTPTTTTSASQQTRHQTGVYAQDQLKILEKWVLTVGGRYDRATSETLNVLTKAVTPQDDGATSYRAGLTYLFDNGVAPYVSYANSFLPTAGTDFNGTPFKPTTGEQYEAGVKYQPKSFNGLFTAAVFDLTQQNVLTPDPAHPGTTFRVQTGEVTSRGIELEAKVSPIAGLNILAAYTHQNVEVTKSNGTDLGKRPAWVANDMRSIWADYTIQSGGLAGFGFGAGIRYVGPTFADSINSLENAATTMVDAMLRYDFGMAHPQLKGLHAALNVNNLFDNEVVVCTALTTCTYGLRRTIIGSLKYRW